MGAIYRIPLTNALGGEGMGLYQMVFPLYTLLLTISGGGLPVAISSLVAVKLSGNDERGARRILTVSLAALSVIGLLFSVTLALSGSLIAALQGNGRAKTAYLGIAPAVFFVSVLACFRGYYQGRENMLPTAVSQLIEQAVKLVAGLYLAARLSSRGVEYAVLGALLGVSLSEAIATLVLSAWFLLTSARIKRSEKGRVMRKAAFSASRDYDLGSMEKREERRRRTPKVAQLRARARRRDEQERNRRAAVASVVSSEIAADGTAIGILPEKALKPQKTDDSVLGILKSVFRVALPVTFGSLVLPVTQVVDSVLIINILSMSGSAQSATGAYGLLSGTVTTLINMPTVVIFAFSVALLPKIARLSGETDKMQREAGFSFRLCVALGLALGAFMFVYARPLVEILYSRGLTEEQIAQCSSLLRLSSPSVFFVSVIQVSTAVLQGVRQPKRPAVNLLIGAALKLVLSAVLLPVLGIYGAVVGSVGCYALTACLDAVAARKVVQSVGGKTPLALVPALTVTMLVGFLAVELTRSPLYLFLAAVVGITLFFAVLCVFGWFSRREIARILPFFKQ